MGRVIVPTVILVAGLLLWGGADAVFSRVTATPTNNWSSGTVSLSDDDLGAAVFAVSSLVPASTGVKCIVVSYGGSVTAAVKLYVTGYSSSRALGAYLNLTVEEGSGSTFAGSGPASCPGFTPTGTIYAGTVDHFATTSTAYASGVGAFAPTGAGQNRVFRFSYTLDATAPEGTQSGVASVGFTWEANST